MWCTEEGTARTMKSAKQIHSEAMKVFLLSADGGISAFASEPTARTAIACGDSLFDGPAELNRLTAEWPRSRLVGLWNSIPGMVPVKRFKDRSTGLKRIWEAIQTLEPVRPEENDVPPPEGSPRKARSGTKKAALLALLARKRGRACGKSWRH